MLERRTYSVQALNAQTTAVSKADEPLKHILQISRIKGGKKASAGIDYVQGNQINNSNQSLTRC